MLAAIHDAVAQASELAQPGHRPAGLGGPRRPARLSRRAPRVRRPRPGPHRRARPAARHRPQVGPAHRLPPAEAAKEDAAAPGPRHHRGQGPGVLLHPVLQRGRAPSRVRHLHRPPARAATVCVVEEPRDIVAVEKTQEYRGRYHVLQGAISPIEGIGPEQLRVRELLARLEPEGDHRGDPLHQPQHRGRGHGDVPGPPARAPSASRSPASPAACRSAATSSTPTSSPSAGRSRAAARSSTRSGSAGPARQPSGAGGAGSSPRVARAVRKAPSSSRPAASWAATHRTSDVSHPSWVGSANRSGTSTTWVVYDQPP